MKSLLTEHVVARLRLHRPLDGHIVPGSTPVLSFGDAAQAVVATVGLNPSRKEFLDDAGRELNDNSRRFETMRSLGVPDLATASDALLSRVVQACNNYFAVNPYRRWFNQLEPILRKAGVSYYDGSACHLDLVQWATDPVWGKIPDRAVRARLLERDVPFLRQQLTTGSFRLVLLNGSGVTEQFQSALGISLRHVDTVTGNSVSTRLLIGNLAWGTRVVAWSINLQSTPGVDTDLLLMDRLAVRVAELSHNDLTG